MRKYVLIAILLLSLGALAGQGKAKESVSNDQHSEYYCMTTVLAGGLGLLTLWLGILLIQRRRMTKTLQRSQVILSDILQGIDDPITMMDRDLNLLWANAAAKKLFGGDIVGRKCYEVTHGRARPCEPYPCQTLRAFQDGQAYHKEGRLTAPSGETRHFLYSANVASRDNEGKATAVVEIARDITAIKQAQEELHLAKYANDSSVTPIGMADLEGRLTYVNKAFLDLWGYSSPQEVLGREVVEFHQVPYELQAVPRELKENGEWSGALRGKKKDGSVFNVDAQAYLTRNSQGDPTCMTGYFFDVSEKKKAEREIRHLAYFDTLTDLPNRALLTDHIEQALDHATRSGESVAILLLDLDNFKQVNDSLGHAKGDQALQEVADRLGTEVRKGDSLARWSGDEFVFLLTGLKSEVATAVLARRILDLLTERSFKLDGSEFFFTASIGIALFPQDGQDVEALLQHADTAMYEAKRAGGNGYHFFSEELHQKTIERQRMEGNLRRALQQEEFFLVYQPQIDFNTGEAVGVEALVRWQDPENGLVSPGQFIPIAEETGLIWPLGEWILRTACAHAAAWQRAGNPSLRLAVNLSARQFQQPELVERIELILKETGLNPQFLELEITESVFMENLEGAIEVLVDLKARGIQIAIDDFGTGYSSLSYLKNFPVDRIKIAQEFVRDIPADPNDVAIVEATIAMAKSLGLKIIAEGVETKEQLDFLARRGCREMQGYYFARPMVAELMENFVNGRRVQQAKIQLSGLWPETFTQTQLL